MFGSFFGMAGAVLLIVSLSLALVIACDYHGAKREAELFEKLTGKHVTVEDAMYLDLRVVAPPKENNNAS